MENRNIMNAEKEYGNDAEYLLNTLQKDEIMERLKKCGCRMTKQRELLIDVILDGECSSCKEIYYQALKKMPKIGIATIYRMINSLEDIGVIKRKNIYHLNVKEDCVIGDCLVELENQKSILLTEEEFKCVVTRGMQDCGYMEDEKVRQVRAKN